MQRLHCKKKLLALEHLPLKHFNFNKAKFLSGSYACFEKHLPPALNSKDAPRVWNSFSKG
jgi:hypothetical protein